jgi:hypothetical protein
MTNHKVLKLYVFLTCQKLRYVGLLSTNVEHLKTCFKFSGISLNDSNLIFDRLRIFAIHTLFKNPMHGFVVHDSG